MTVGYMYDQLLESYCLTEYLWRCGLWLNNKSYNKSVWRSEQEVPPRNTILQLSTYASTPSSQTLPPFEP